MVVELVDVEKKVERGVLFSGVLGLGSATFETWNSAAAGTIRSRCGNTGLRRKKWQIGTSGKISCSGRSRR
jgi:hypothetical protein